MRDAFNNRLHINDALTARDWPTVARLADAMAEQLDAGAPPQAIYQIGHQPMQGADTHAREAVERFHRALARARARAAKKGR